jgi:hypothetical protein
MGMLLLGMGGITLAALTFQFLCYLTSPREEKH